MNQKVLKLMKNITSCMVVAAVLLAFLISGIRILGFQVYGVLTGSMAPTYPVGSLIYVKSVDTSELRVQDVITFSLPPNTIVTHRIVEMVPDENNPSIIRYRTKGDANNDVDASLVSAGNIIGKVMFAVPQLGYFANYIQEPPGIYVAILVCGLMIAFVFYTDSLENKQKQQKAGQKTSGENKAGLVLTKWVNQASQKVLGKPLIKQPKADPSGPQQGYMQAQQPVQPYSGQQPNPQQYAGYPQQMYGGQQPAYYQQQPQYYQQQYGQQSYPPQGYMPGTTAQPYQQNQTAYPQTAPVQYGQQQYANPYPSQPQYTQQPSYGQQNNYPQQPVMTAAQSQQAPQYRTPYPPNPVQAWNQQTQNPPSQNRRRRTYQGDDNR